MADPLPGWTLVPAAERACVTRRYGVLVRMARTAAGLTLDEAGALAGYSASTLSRIERGKQPLTDVTRLRQLAKVFGIPLHLFGLTESMDKAPNRTPAVRVISDACPEGDESMRRRQLLTGIAAATAASLVPSGEAQALPSGTRITGALESMLFQPSTSQPAPAPVSELRSAIAAGWTNLQAARYTRVIDALPSLIGAAEATRDASGVDARCGAAALVASAYNLATEVLVKLHENGMAYATADRATQAARQADDPMITAETARQAAIVLRRTRHRDGAQQLVLNTAHRLDSDTGLRDPAQAGLYAQLLATASYTASLRGDGASAWSLIQEAGAAASRVQSGGFGGMDIALYKIGIARALGDYGAAATFSRAVNPALISTPERRARYFEDAALAFHGCGDRTATYRALLAAESCAPEEVRYRPWAQRVTTSLLNDARSSRLPGLREFAGRVGAA
ncbi:helix-turn-helix transcriptional regulator [Longispora sp. K20-0274]|uniref:helix-turn-helix domain-containing protein n=1 Tax=Longispora sp. K20-0274 TaxID=3088255 RepID=UPI00399C3015